MVADIVSFDRLPAAEEQAPDPGRVLAGAPRQKIWNLFSDSTGQFHAGKWSSTPGRWRVRYTENEFCYLLSGRVVLESDMGLRTEFAAGQAFVVPQGFSGIWDVQVPTEKLYVIFEAATPVA
jgi:uncharacterized cupin superfamily protein